MIHRGRALATLLLVLAAGLASRRIDGLPSVVEDHVGDVLWATAVVLALAVVWPAHRPEMHAAAGFAIAFIVELSQLWNPEWLDDLRANDLAALVLGRGFLWADLPRYAVGCLLGYGLLRWVVRTARS